MNVLAEEREGRLGEDKARSHQRSCLRHLMALTMYNESPSMRGGRHHEHKKSSPIGKKKGKREARDWPNLQFTAINDKTPGKKMLQPFEEIKIRRLIK